MSVTATKLLIITALAALSAGEKCYNDPPEQVVGPWGGEHMGLVASDTGAAIEYDCASGAITQPLHVSSDGSFNWQGVFYPGHPGPERVGEQPQPHPAVYSGRIAGDAMAISLHVTDSLNITQEFTLAKGANAKVYKCY
jgi:hypothetical protein